MIGAFLASGRLYAYKRTGRVEKPGCFTVRGTGRLIMAVHLMVLGPRANSQTRQMAHWCVCQICSRASRGRTMDESR